MHLTDLGDILFLCCTDIYEVQSLAVELTRLSGTSVSMGAMLVAVVFSFAQWPRAICSVCNSVPSSNLY